MTTHRRQYPLGFWMATALVVGNMIGSGTFLLPASLAPYGAASLLGWGLTTCGALLLAGVYAQLGRRFPRTGGPYTYSRLAFGEFAGFATAWLYWVSIWCGNAAIAVAFAGYLGGLVPAATATPARAAATALAAVWLCTAFNLMGLRSAGWVQLVTTVAKLVPLLVIAVVGVWWLEPAAYRPGNPSGATALSVTTATAALTLWALLGLECATVPADDVRDAERTVPRATLFGTALAASATVLACTVVIGLVPMDVLGRSGAPFAVAAVALVLSSLTTTALVIANYQDNLVVLFTWAILLSTASVLVPYLLNALALIRLAGRASRRTTLVGLLAGGFSIWALIGTGAESLLWGTALLAAGVPVYVFLRDRNPRAPTAPRGTM